MQIFYEIAINIKVVLVLVLNLVNYKNIAYKQSLGGVFWHEPVTNRQCPSNQPKHLSNHKVPH